MNGKSLLYVDQYGNRFYAATAKALREQIGMGSSRIAKMYCDKRDGSTVHTGYVIGQHWLTAYTPFELAA
jgi:hypothetical protein